MTRERRRVIVAIVAIFMAGAVVLVIARKTPQTDNQQLAPAPDQGETKTPVKVLTPPVQDDPAVAEAPAPPADTGRDAAAVEAGRAFTRGLQLHQAGKLIPARTELSRAFFSGKLTTDEQARAVRILSDLAAKTVLSPEFQDGEPYAIAYTFQPGEVLQNVERKLKLHVPSQGILMVNRIANAEKIQAGQTLKMIRGPFHALVTKGDFTMDIYLQRDDLPKVFIKRVKVGLGRNGGTPVGAWRVRLGKKLWRATYYPTPNSPNRDRGPIAFGRPGYPFGQKGLWIALEGTDARTRQMSNYGIHSTNEPASIGREGSEGCIRLGDEDIDLVWNLLYEHWSTIETRP